MDVRISVILVLGIVVIALIRGGSLKAGPAIVSILFGFFLASTTLAPTITKFVATIAKTVSSISF
ncbi:hypothetical protein [Streptomyces lydicus]|uniref:hypothetical protein n=1 Tax=Streptomyces lydicus TaxID=47763 RepID=UPI0037A13D74